MVKRIIVLLLSVLLCACANTNSIEKQLDDVFSSSEINKVRVNNYTNYIEYYLPSDVNEENSEPLSFVFSLDDCKLVMNVNIPNILNKEYYNETQLNDEGFFDENKLIYSNQGDYLNDGKTTRYFFKTYQYEDECLLYFVSDDVNFYGYGPLDKVSLLASKILQMAKAVNVHTDRVIADFSTADVIDYQRSTINLFEKTLPKDGPVDEFIIGNGEQVSD